MNNPVKRFLFLGSTCIYPRLAKQPIKEEELLASPLEPTNEAYALAKSEGYYKEKPAAEVGIEQLSLPGGDWDKGYRLGFYPQIRSVMEREYNRIFSGETTPKDAMGIGIPPLFFSSPY